MKHFDIKIYGLVQGVFFRDNAKKEADKLSIMGFVKNFADGSVYVEAEGEKKNLDEFVIWCYKGPTTARVEKAVVTENKLKNFLKFEIY